MRALIKLGVSKVFLIGYISPLSPKGTNSFFRVMPFLSLPFRSLMSRLLLQLAFKLGLIFCEPLNILAVIHDHLHLLLGQISELKLQI